MNKKNYALRLALSCDLVSVFPITMLVFVGILIGIGVTGGLGFVDFLLVVLWVVISNGVLFLITWLIGYIYSKCQRIRYDDEAFYAGLGDVRYSWVNVRYVTVKRFILVYDVDIKVRRADKNSAKNFAYFFITKNEMVSFVRESGLDKFMRDNDKKKLEAIEDEI